MVECGRAQSTSISPDGGFVCWLPLLSVPCCAAGPLCAPLFWSPSSMGSSVLGLGRLRTGLQTSSNSCISTQNRWINVYINYFLLNDAVGWSFVSQYHNMRILNERTGHNLSVTRWDRIIKINKLCFASLKIEAYRLFLNYENQNVNHIFSVKLFSK